MDGWRGHVLYTLLERLGATLWGYRITLAQKYPHTLNPGDIVVYQGNQIVMFYGANTWSYTMLGHVDDLTNWEAALSPDEVTAVFSL